MKRETGAIAQCHISSTQRVKKPSAGNRDMLCVYSGCADVDVAAGLRNGRAPEPAGWNREHNKLLWI